MNEYLKEAKSILSNFYVLFCYDYGNYYYFTGIYKNEINEHKPIIRNGIAINKNDCKKKNDWNSVNLVLDEIKEEIDLKPYLNETELIIIDRIKGA